MQTGFHQACPVATHPLAAEQPIRQAARQVTREDYLEVAMRVLGLYAWVQGAFAAVQGLASVPLIFVSMNAPSDPHP